MSCVFGPSSLLLSEFWNVGFEPLAPFKKKQQITLQIAAFDGYFLKRAATFSLGGFNT